MYDKQYMVGNMNRRTAASKDVVTPPILRAAISPQEMIQSRIMQQRFLPPGQAGGGQRSPRCNIVQTVSLL